MRYVVAADAEKFLRGLKDQSVDLFLIDPPYFKIVRDLWDHQWKSAEQYVEQSLAIMYVITRRFIIDDCVVEKVWNRFRFALENVPM